MNQDSMGWDDGMMMGYIFVAAFIMTNAFKYTIHGLFDET